MISKGFWPKIWSSILKMLQFGHFLSDKNVFLPKNWSEFQQKLISSVISHLIYEGTFGENPSFLIVPSAVPLCSVHHYVLQHSMCYLRN